jgi:hypothetical protein
MKIALFACILLTLPCKSNAAAPSAKSVERLVALSISNDTIAAMRRSIEDSQMKILDQALVSTDLGKITEAISRKLKSRIEADIGSEFSEQNLRAFYCYAFANTYTQEEVDGILAFFDTAPDKAYLAKKTALISDLSNTVSARPVAFAAKIMQEVQLAVNETQSATPAATPSK